MDNSIIIITTSFAIVPALKKSKYDKCIWINQTGRYYVDNTLIFKQYYPVSISVFNLFLNSLNKNKLNNLSYFKIQIIDYEYKWLKLKNPDYFENEKLNPNEDNLSFRYLYFNRANINHENIKNYKNNILSPERKLFTLFDTIKTTTNKLVKCE